MPPQLLSTWPHRLMRLAVVLAGAAAILAACGSREHVKKEEPVAMPAKPYLHALPGLAHVQLKGDLGTRYTAATANLLAHKDCYTPETFRSSATATPGALWGDWPGDQIGRFLSVLSVAEAYGWPNVSASREMVLNNSLPYQTPQGCFGQEKPLDQKDAKIVSGNAFALRGIVDAYADSRDPRWLAAARRMRDYYAATFPYWHASGKDGHLHEFWGHCLDGLVKLHDVSGDPEALELAKRIAATAGRTPHAHHSLSLCRGLIDLYADTGDPAYLAPVRDYLAWCAEVRLADGAIPEFIPQWTEDEGCALADYVVVNLMMYRATGESAFLEDAELTLVNHFFMNQFYTGGFGHRAFASEVVGGKDWQGWRGRFGSENPGCCSLWGQWALGQVGNYLILRGRTSHEYYVNLYAEGTVEFPEDGARFEITGDFPRMSHARITIEGKRAKDFALNLRVPPWAGSVSVQVNGKPDGRMQENGRLVVGRRWKVGDTVDVSFTGGLRVIHWPRPDSPKAAVFDGPLCLALCSADADVTAAWSLALDAAGKPVRDGQGHFQLAHDATTAWLPLRPVAEDWKNPDVHNPHSLRILFGVTSE